MTNITGVPAFGGGGVAFRQPPDPPQPAVPAISQTGLNGAATYTKGNELPGQNGANFSYRSSSEAEEEERGSAPKPAPETDADFETTSKHPDDILTGPTPAFQASVLEVELDLRNALAEIAAKRTQAADEAAISPVEQPPEDSRPSDISRPDRTALSELSDTRDAATPPDQSPTGSEADPSQTSTP